MTQNKIIIFMVSVCLLFVAVTPTNSNMEANLVSEFSIPATVGGVVANILEASATTVTVISILTVVATGGAGLIAAAGRAGLSAYLKKELTNRGRAAFIAW